jgi:hypothetical protein
MPTKQNSIKLKQCKECEQLFYAPRCRSIIYCSEKCRKEARLNQQRLARQKNDKTRKCKVCHSKFEANTHNKKYCSKDCQIIGTRQLNLLKKTRYKKIAPHLIYNKNVKHVSNLVDWSHRRELEIEKQILCYQEQEKQ